MKIYKVGFNQFSKLVVIQNLNSGWYLVVESPSKTVMIESWPKGKKYKTPFKIEYDFERTYLRASIAKTLTIDYQGALEFIADTVKDRDKLFDFLSYDETDDDPCKIDNDIKNLFAGLRKLLELAVWPPYIPPSTTSDSD